MTVDEVAHEVGHDEQRQDESDGGFGTKGLGHEHDIQRGCATQAGFRQTNANCGDGRQHQDMTVSREKCVLQQPVGKAHSMAQGTMVTGVPVGAEAKIFCAMS